MSRLLKEPLLHFLILGGLLFGAAEWRDSTPESDGAQPVQVTEQDVQWLKETWTRQWLREPTAQEMRGLVREFLKEELMAREAAEMGLGDNDTIIRRRLAQKLDFVLQDRHRLTDPDQAELQTYFAANAEKFRIQPRISFEQIFFSRDRRSAPIQDADQARRQMASGRKPPRGDATFLNAELADVDKDSVAKQFGPEFTEKVFALPSGRWSEPIESTFGVHLVRVSGTQAAAMPEFSKIRDKVLERWHDDNQTLENEKYFASLLKKYGVPTEIQ